MTPQEQARVDQVRAGLQEAIITPCQCGDCPTEDQLRQALTLDDEALLAVILR